MLLPGDGLRSDQRAYTSNDRKLVPKNLYGTLLHVRERREANEGIVSNNVDLLLFLSFTALGNAKTTPEYFACETDCRLLRGYSCSLRGEGGGVVGLWLEDDLFAPRTASLKSRARLETTATRRRAKGRVSDIASGEVAAMEWKYDLAHCKCIRRCRRMLRRKN